MSDEGFTMHEMKRYGVIAAALEAKMTNKEASESLRLSCRQVQRIKKRVRAEGPTGVCHGNKGRKPTHTLEESVRQRVLELAKGKYHGFNFSHLTEFLEEEESMRLSRETVRKWLRADGLGRKPRKMKRHRRKRPRSCREGQLLFLDGSPHRWFADVESTLILATDDATGAPLHGLFQKEEDLDGCFSVCLSVFAAYGLPGGFYLDRASHFITTRHGGVHVDQSAKKPTQFERAMQELGIRLIFANSPQARGRGERINGSFQDRLVAEFRLHGIATAEQATEYLNAHFIPRYRSRFAVPPADPMAAWRPLPQGLELRNVLCRRAERTVSNMNTVSINGRLLQLEPTATRRHFVRAKVTVHQWPDGSLHVIHPRNGEIAFRLLAPERTSHANECGRLKERGRPEPPPGSRPASEARALPLGLTSPLAPAASSLCNCARGDIFTLQQG